MKKKFSGRFESDSDVEVLPESEPKVALKPPCRGQAAVMRDGLLAIVCTVDGIDDEGTRVTVAVIDHTKREVRFEPGRLWGRDVSEVPLG